MSNEEQPRGPLDRQPDWRRRWYVTLPLITMLAGILAPVLSALLVPRVHDAAMVAQGTLLVAAMLWMLGPAIYWLSADPLPEKTESPRRHATLMQRAARTPLMLALIFAGAIAGLLVLDRIFLPLRLEAGLRWSGVASAAAAVPLFFWGRWWARVLDRRVRRAAAERRQCFGCGYDLRGTTRGVCPECGESLAAQPPCVR